VLLSPDGTIDFGSVLRDDDRWERTELFRKRIRIGEVVSFWAGTDDLPKCKDDESFFRLCSMMYSAPATGGRARFASSPQRRLLSPPIRFQSCADSHVYSACAFSIARYFL
jgi:hypothetical protein